MGRSAIPDPLLRLINSLSTLPGIGEKSATRLAFHILRAPDKYAQALSQAIIDTKNNVVLCPVCSSFTSGDLCDICSSDRRDRAIICVVEEPLDMIALERTGEFHGLYHVLHGVISPIDGVGPNDLKISELLTRIGKGETSEVGEVIVATNPSVEGEATALYLAKLIKPLNVEVTRIAHGVPMGGDIEYIDELTLGKALKERKKI